MIHYLLFVKRTGGCYNVAAMAQTVLIISSHKDIRSILKKHLIAQKHDVHVVSSSTTVHKYLRRTVPDVVILDSPLEGISARIFVREIKKTAPDTPIIVLQDEKARKFSTGDESLLTKPLDMELFSATVLTKLSQKKTRETSFQVADLIIDIKKQAAHRSGEPLILTPQEFKLLAYLMQSAGKVVTRQKILSRIWLYSTEVETRVVDVYIGYLRKKIDGPGKQKLLYSIRGLGYMIKA